MNAASIRDALRQHSNGCDCAKSKGLTHCPAHDDKHPSLSITDHRGDKLLVHCHAGCSQSAVVAALKERGLWPDGEPKADSQPIETRYTLPGGFEHVRLDYPTGDKRFYWYRDGKPGLGGLKTAELGLYGAEHLAELVPGSVVLLCEGEKATEAARKLGYAAVGTVTGAGNPIPTDERLRILLPFDVVTWADNDELGRAHMQSIAERLLAMGGTARKLTWPGSPEKGDAHDFWAETVECWKEGPEEYLSLLVEEAELYAVTAAAPGRGPWNIIP